MTEYRAPFPYFGGKSTIAADVWQRFGADVKNYVEPFAGSLAVLLARPNWTPERRVIETVNDANGFVANFWRSLQYALACQWRAREQMDGDMLTGDVSVTMNLYRPAKRGDLDNLIKMMTRKIHGLRL